jgi:hypothetical protein
MGQKCPSCPEGVNNVSAEWTNTPHGLSSRASGVVEQPGEPRTVVNRTVVDRTVTYSAVVDRTVLSRTLRDRTVLSRTLRDRTVLSRSLLYRAPLGRSLLYRAPLDRTLLYRALFYTAPLGRSLLSRTLLDRHERLLNYVAAGSVTVVTPKMGGFPYSPVPVAPARLASAVLATEPAGSDAPCGQGPGNVLAISPSLPSRGTNDRPTV